MNGVEAIHVTRFIFHLLCHIAYTHREREREGERERERDRERERERERRCERMRR